MKASQQSSQNEVYHFEHNHFSGGEQSDSIVFKEPVAGIAFLGTGPGNSTLSIIDLNERTVLRSGSGLAQSFYASRGSRVMHGSEVEACETGILISYIPVRLINPKSTEHSFIGEHFNELIGSDQSVRFGPYCYISPTMQAALDKIVHNHYEGEPRELLFQSQTTELLAHFFANLSKPHEHTFSPEETSKLYKVKDIIVACDNKPPTIHEISRMVGLSTSFLKKNFKELFGEPVYQYGLNQRLAKAYELLSNENISIKEAAWVAGYDSLGSFSNAFNKRFGYRPSKLKHHDLPIAS